MFRELTADEALIRTVTYQTIKKALLVWVPGDSSSDRLRLLLETKSVDVRLSACNFGKSQDCRIGTGAHNNTHCADLEKELSDCQLLLIDATHDRRDAVDLALKNYDLLPAGGVIALWNMGANWRAGHDCELKQDPRSFADPAIRALEVFVQSRQLDFFVSDNCLFLIKPSRSLCQLKDKYRGQRVFVVGNGPSLNDTELDLIADDPAIAMNRISLIYPRTKWRPSFYIYCSDNVRNPSWGADWRKSINRAVSDPKTQALIWRRYGDAIEAPEGVTWIDTMSEMEIGTDGTFFTNADQAISKTGTTINVAYQLAYYMGFSQIFLIGADLSWVTGGHEGEDLNHFDPSYRAKIPDGEIERRRMRLTHKKAKAFFDAAGIKVFNATTTTFLDIFPLVDFETVAKNKDWDGPLQDADQPGVAARRQAIRKYWQLI